MSWPSIHWVRRNSSGGADQAPVWLRITGLAVRAVFIACLLVITVLVSLPQNETIWTVYDTLGDLVRLILGFAVCIWIAVQFFRAPKDAHSYRTFIYFGLAAIPFALLCIYEIW